MIALLGLCYWVISQESTLQRHGYTYEHTDTKFASYSSTSTSGAGIWTFVFAYYSLFIHCLVFIVPVRACWAVWQVTQSMKRSSRTQYMHDYMKLSNRRRLSSASLSSSETLTSDLNGDSTVTSEAGDTELDMYTDVDDIVDDTVVHAIVIPNYKEDIDTLRETLDVLASHPRAQTAYDVSHPALNPTLSIRVARFLGISLVLHRNLTNRSSGIPRHGAT